MVRGVLRGPLWLAQVATSTKSFEDNGILGSRRLNDAGLHAMRVKLAHRIATRRRRRLAGAVADVHREEFDRNGFVRVENFLPGALFASLHDELLHARVCCKEKREGDTLMRKIAIDKELLHQAPAVARAVESIGESGLISYVGARRDRPVTYVQSIFQRPGGHSVDPQTRLHADSFHPTVKAWLFLTDVAVGEGAFTYVPGSHRLTPARLAWERAKSGDARTSSDLETREGSPRVSEAELVTLGLPPPQEVAVPANTLVVADTFGFHRRGTSTGPSQRVEVWSIGPRSPFLPSQTLDRWLVRATRKVDPSEWTTRDDVCAFDPPSE